MTRPQILFGAAALAFTVAACDGLKEAFTAHVDLVARAEGQELSTERLATLIGNSSVPVRKDIASVVAGFWVSYQLLGYAGAHGDTLGDVKLADKAMWATILTSRARKFYEHVRRSFSAPDTTGLDQKYAQGTLLAAQHIIVMMTDNGAGMSQAKQDSIRRHAEDILRRTTSANFNAMVKQYTEDTDGKERNGSLGVFPLGPGAYAMVPEFEAAVKALKPGEVSPTVLRTSFGYHIIRRHLLSEVRAEFIEKLVAQHETVQRDVYMTKLRTDWKLAVKPEALAKIREAGKLPDEFRTDKTVIATSKLGDFTIGRLTDWIEVFPPQAQVRERLNSAPDTSVIALVQSIVEQEVIGAEAEKANVTADTAELQQIRQYFTTMVKTASSGLRVDPESLGDSAKTTAEKERLAASRVEAALDMLFASSGQNFVEIPVQLAYALRQKYSSRVNLAGLDRAVERGLAVRAALDSTRGGKAPSPQMAPAPQPPPSAPPSGKSPPPGGRKQ